QVDGIAHERGVDRRGAGKQQTLSLLQTRQQVQAEDPLRQPPGDAALGGHRGVACGVDDGREVVSGHPTPIVSVPGCGTPPVMWTEGVVAAGEASYRVI